MKRYKSVKESKYNQLKKETNRIITLKKQGHFGLKTISLHIPRNNEQYQVIIDTEIEKPHSLRGITNSLKRKRFDNYDQAVKSYEKSLKAAFSRGWTEYKG